MKKLKVSFVDPKYWRTSEQKELLAKKDWKTLRLKILIRDDYTCQYCGFRNNTRQIVHHIDGISDNMSEDNLETICPMCNLIHHSGIGCVVWGVVDLYKKSNYSQNEIIQITRRMRLEGKPDEEIIEYLGLKEKVPFKEDNVYLKSLFGFVTSRKTKMPMPALIKLKKC
jgi:hypothetical protein